MDLRAFSRKVEEVSTKERKKRKKLHLVFCACRSTLVVTEKVPAFFAVTTTYIIKKSSRLVIVIALDGAGMQIL